MLTFDGTLGEQFAANASIELELDSTDKLSQNALSLSGLSIRFPPPFIAWLVASASLFGDPLFPGVL